MDIRIRPAQISGEIPAIPSKSYAHRLLICSALSDGRTVLRLPKTSSDIEATAACLRAMGAEITARDGTYTVEPIAALTTHPILNCSDSGSTLRFLLPIAAALCGDASFTGKGRLPERPLSSLAAAMAKRGMRFSSNKLPFDISGRLSAGKFTLPGNISSQYISGLLMALPLLCGKSAVMLESELESGDYVNITLDILRQFGISITEEPRAYLVEGVQLFRSPGEAIVPGDWSNAAFFLAAGAMSGRVTVTGLSTDSAQGDKALIPILRRFGAHVHVGEGSVTCCKGTLSGIELDVSGVPDLVPALSVLAAFAEGKTRFYNAGRLRAKESDRLESTARLINSLGGKAIPLPDSLIVKGSPLTGGIASGCGDHRIVMAAATASAGCKQDVVIRGYEAVNKSYPGFFSDFTLLGGRANAF